MRALAEKIAEAMAFTVTLPTWALYGILRLGTDRLSAFQAVVQRASRWPGIGGILLRQALMRHLLGHIGNHVTLCFGSMVTKPSAKIGNHLYVGAYSMLGDVQIGDNVIIADHVMIPSGAAQHGSARLDIPMRDQSGEFRTVTIGDDVWIGCNSVVLADVGSHCIVGAGSVVTKPVPNYAIVVGNPARQIADRRDKAAQAAPSGTTEKG